MHSQCGMLLPKPKLSVDADCACQAGMTSMDDVIQGGLVPRLSSGFPAHVHAKLRLV